MSKTKILIAPNAFKHALGAEAAASAISKGFLQSRLECVCESFPVGDGGDGTAKLIIEKCNGTYVSSMVHDPLGRTTETSLGFIDGGKTAVIEMADASGLRLLKSNELNPMVATSVGTGEQVIQALDKGAAKIIICMGGSATVDAGMGILHALGVRFLNDDGSVLTKPGDLIKLHSVDITALDQRVFQTEIIVLCDVDNLLLGEKGAAAMFGPQKGASDEDVKTLDKALSRLAIVIKDQTGNDITSVQYGGTAGGASAGLHAFINARLVNGIEYFLTLTNFVTALAEADLVITGEGSIDEQTLQGKGPFGVASLAKQRGLPVIALAGKVPLENSAALSTCFDSLIAISHQALSLEDAIASTKDNLVRVATQLGNLLATQRSEMRDHNL